jgi:hypothetical protein
LDLRHTEMLKHAVQWGYLDANPAQYAERPRAEEQEMEILTPPEIRRGSAELDRLGSARTARAYRTSSATRCSGCKTGAETSKG